MLKKLVGRLTKSIEDEDREHLSAYCDLCELTPIDEIVARSPVRVGGEVRSVTIVPRAGAPALEVTVHDGRGTIVGVFLGRRRIAGLSPGRRVSFQGMAGKDGNRLIVFNPVYEILS